MPDYIPSRESDKLLWLTNFNSFAQAQGAALGASPAQLADLGTGVTTAFTSKATADTAQASAQAAVATKNTDISAAVALARALAQFFQNNPAMTDAQRAQAGMTIPDTTPTPGGGVDISLLPPPLVVLDFSKRNMVTVHWGVNPGNEANNAKPAGVLGAQIEYARGGIPANEASWVVLDRDTESPLPWTFSESVSIKLAFRARWVGKNLRLGTAGDPVTCNLTV